MGRYSIPAGQQRGGAMKTIKSLLPDEVNSPEKLDEQMEFNLIAGHGITLTKSIMIVPENTFIIFMGPSGFILYAAHIREALLTGWGNRQQYMETMYKEFVTGETHSRPYPGALVYTPGDVMHNMRISFDNTYSDETFFRTGVYPLPVTDVKEFGGESDIFKIPFLVNLVKTHPTKMRPIVTKKLKSEMEPTWKRLLDSDDANNAYLLLSNGNESLKKLETWFEDPHDIQTIINKYAIDNSHGNRFKSLTKRKLSALLKDLGSGSGRKKYKFYIVSSCRPDDLDYGLTAETAERGQVPKYFGPITNVLQSRRQLRRTSFSLKGEDVVCPLGPGVRPMNLARLKGALEEIGDGGFEGKLEKRLIEFLYRYFFEKTGGAEGEGSLTYHTEMEIQQFATVINLLYIDYPLLNSEAEANAEKRREFEKILKTLQGIFKDYVLGTKKNLDEDVLHTGTPVPRQILYSLGYGKGIKINNTEWDQILRRVDKMMAKEVAAAASAKERAEKEEAIAKYTSAIDLNMDANHMKVIYVEFKKKGEEWSSKSAEIKDKMKKHDDIEPLKIDAEPRTRVEADSLVKRLREHTRKLHDLLGESYTMSGELFKILLVLEDRLIRGYELSEKHFHAYLTADLNMDEEMREMFMKPYHDMKKEMVDMKELYQQYKVELAKIPKMVGDAVATNNRAIDTYLLAPAAAGPATKEKSKGSPGAAGDTKGKTKSLPAAALAAAAATAAPVPTAPTGKSVPAWVLKMRERQAARNTRSKNSKKGGGRRTRRRGT
jgi:hypothetical protein